MSDSKNFSVAASGERDIIITRDFNAPRRLVFEAYTKPELLKRWLLGPPGWEMISCEVAAKVGDSYRYVWRHADGKQFGMGGVCREFVPPERMVCTENMDGYPSEALITTVLLERGGTTKLTTTATYVSREVRDMALKSGMERGVAASYDRLDEILAANPSQASSRSAD
jgi:uncharacterized protein YndB with AHSA1/START domain